MSHQLTFDNLLLNPSVEQADEGRLSRQAKAILGLFRGRMYLGMTVSTIDLAREALQYNARINELRHFLAPQGWFIDLIKSDAKAKGVNHYAIVKFAKSTFEGKEKFLVP